jgi:hypothetical protein
MQLIAQFQSTQIERYFNDDPGFYESIDIFTKNGHTPIEFEQFVSEFVSKEFDISQKYFQKIGTGKFQRYHTSWDENIFLSRIIPNIQEDVTHMPGVLWAHVITTNGYIPWHSRREKIIGEHEYDIEYNQNKVIRIDCIDNAFRAYATNPFWFVHNDEKYALTAWPIVINSNLWGSFVIAYKSKFDTTKKIETIIYCLLLSLFIGAIISFAAKKIACGFIKIFLKEYDVAKRNTQCD